MAGLQTRRFIPSWLRTNESCYNGTLIMYNDKRMKKKKKTLEILRVTVRWTDVCVGAMIVRNQSKPTFFRYIHTWQRRSRSLTQNNLNRPSKQLHLRPTPPTPTPGLTTPQNPSRTTALQIRAHIPQLLPINTRMSLRSNQHTKYHSRRAVENVFVAWLRGQVGG